MKNDKFVDKIIKRPSYLKKVNLDELMDEELAEILKYRPKLITNQKIKNRFEKFNDDLKINYLIDNENVIKFTDLEKIDKNRLVELLKYIKKKSNIYRITKVLSLK